LAPASVSTEALMLVAVALESPWVLLPAVEWVSMSVPVRVLV